MRGLGTRYQMRTHLRDLYCGQALAPDEKQPGGKARYRSDHYACLYSKPFDRKGY
jgi:hypothetical protein